MTETPHTSSPSSSSSPANRPAAKRSGGEAGKRAGGGPAAGASRPPTLREDLRRIAPVWLVLLAAAFAVILWFGKSGSRVIANLAYTSPDAWELARVFRADGTQGWRACLERVNALRTDGKPLGSAIGVLKNDATLTKARQDLLKAHQFYSRFDDVPGMLSDLALWDGDAALAYAWRGDQAAIKGGWSEALTNYTVALDMGSATAQVAEGRLEAFVQLKRWDDASSVALALEGKEFLTSRYYRLTASIEQRRGNREAEAAALQKAVEVDPRDVDSAIRLADFLVAAGRRDEAAALYARTTDLVRNNGHLWHRAALLARDMDQTDSAIELYKKAIAVQPNIYTLHYELGQLYIKAGQPGQAKPYLTRAFELNPKLFEKEKGKDGK